MEDGAVGHNFDREQTTQGPSKKMFGLIWSSDFRFKKVKNVCHMTDVELTSTILLKYCLKSSFYKCCVRYIVLRQRSYEGRRSRNRIILGFTPVCCQEKQKVEP
jgi:hypothetical protein